MIGFHWHPCDPDSPNDSDRITIYYSDRLPQTISGQEASVLLKSILRGVIHRSMAVTFPGASKAENQAAA